MSPRDRRLHPAWWTLILVALFVGIVLLVSALFSGTLSSYVPVTLTSDRAGLVMESGAKVKLRGVQVGRVSQISTDPGAVRLELELYPDQIEYIPANVEARIQATTAFGAKYVDLVVPSDPSNRPLVAGAVLRSQNVSPEVNTVFQNLVNVLDQVNPAKLNGTLTAFADGVRGQSEAIGQATTDANEVLQAYNPRFETIRRDWQAFKGFNDAYSGAAGGILSTLDAASTTSTTIADRAGALDALLLNLIGLSNTGIELIAPNQQNLVDSINTLRPTADLLLKYNPSLTCMLVGAHWTLENGAYDHFGGNGRTAILDAGLMFGDDAYRYPEHLPVIGAKGGPGGKPSCGSLPYVDEDFPVRHLVTDTGFGTGMDVRPNPGIGFPGWANYLPGTRAVPEPPSIRNLEGGPAIGPVPYPGAPAYGAQLYAPDGTPLWPGLPPAPPPGAPREPGPPPPGSEASRVAHPAQMQPTPTPHLPELAAP
ncbi:MAG TPA: MCE family protein [Mycobacterium sp.]